MYFQCALLFVQPSRFWLCMVVYGLKELAMSIA